MILQVNDINFENMTNDEAVKVLREVVQKPGPVKLVVAKCWDPNPKGEITKKIEKFSKKSKIAQKI